jgi:hypothetical protein
VPVTDELWEAWRTTTLRIHLPGGAVEVAAVPGGGADGPFPAGGPFHLVTAWNPGAEETPPAENARRHDRLVAALAADGRRWYPSVGTSADGTWHEEGVALTGVTRAEAVAVADRFGQLAPPEWADGPDGLRVVVCATGEVVSWGWRSRPVA